MQTCTKKKRAIIALKILERYQGQELALNSWLKILNDDLGGHYTFKSSKELAYMFRYMHNIMHVDIIRIKEITDWEHNQIINTCYIYQGEKN